MRARKSVRILLLALCCLLALPLTGCGDKSGAYDKALALFGQGDYAQAAAAFDRLGDYLQAETYAAYAQGLTFWEQGNFIAAEPLFAKTRDFMYGEQRYQFCHAYALEEAGQYEEAAQAYAALGEFEDAPRRAAYNEARAAMDADAYETALLRYQDADGYRDAAERLDALSFAVFERASALKSEGDYAQAFVLFTLLGDRYGAAEQARECKNIYLDQAYADAENLVTQGDLQGAYEQFTMLIGYRDAAVRAGELADLLGIDTTPAE